MVNLQEAVQQYVAELAKPHSEAWWQQLVELGPDALPLVMDAFSSCSNPRVRCELVTAIWQFRRPESVRFLGSLLRDRDAEIRKSALDGLVTLATDEALAVLRKEDAAGGPMAGAWIREAIDQIREARRQMDDKN